MRTNDGKLEAHTLAKVAQRFEGFSLLELQLVTGRKTPTALSG